MILKGNQATEPANEWLKTFELITNQNRIHAQCIVRF